MGPYAGVDYNLTLCLLQSLNTFWQPYARVVLNPMPELTLSPVRDLGFGLRFPKRRALNHSWRNMELGHSMLKGAQV